MSDGRCASHSIYILHMYWNAQKTVKTQEGIHAISFSRDRSDLYGMIRILNVSNLKIQRNMAREKQCIPVVLLGIDKVGLCLEVIPLARA
jgi:hypothetical protein